MLIGRVADVEADGVEAERRNVFGVHAEPAADDHGPPAGAVRAAAPRTTR